MGNKSADVVPLMFMVTFLVKELRVPQQKTELINKRRQNNAHHHTKAAIRGTILDLLTLMDDIIAKTLP